MEFFRRLFGGHLPHPPTPTSSPAQPPSPASMPQPVQTASPLPPTRDATEDDDAGPQALLAAISSFVHTPLDQKRALLHATPLLLTSGAVTLLTTLAERAKAEQTELVQVFATYATLLYLMQREGIDTVMNILESAPTGLGESGDTEDLFRQWLDTSTYHEERRFLQANPDLVSAASEEHLRQALEWAQQHELPDAQRKGQIIEEAHKRLYLMRGLRTRLARLPQPATPSAVTAALLEGYIDWSGGFIHDLPTWLDATIQEDATLRNQGPAYQTAQARVTLWRATRERAHREALAPEIQAEIMGKQRNALNDIADGTRSNAQEAAIHLLHACLDIFTSDRYPTRWAMTQNNLGNTYQTRIRGNQVENQEQSIACYTAALRVYTEATLPREWAMTQHNLGAVYHDRIRGNQVQNHEQSIACYTAALRVCTEATLPLEWAMTQNNLGSTYRTRIRGDQAENCEQSIACYTAALRVYTEATLPLEWAMTQHNLGAVYHDRIRGEHAENHEQSIACFTAALRVYTEATFPLEWAMTQHNLGNTYQARIRGDQAENCEQSIACYTAALRIRTEVTLPALHRDTVLNLAQMLARQAQWNAVVAAYHSALRTEETLVALADGVKGQDAILAEGRDGAARAAYALMHLGQLGEAALTLERGRARGRAAARALDAADPQRIRDPHRRADYIATRTTWQKALAAVQQPEKRLPLPEEVPPAQRDEVRRLRDELHARQRAADQRLRAAKAAFDATVAAIQAAGDPADFLSTDITEAQLLRAVQHGLSGHAVVTLIATPQGGMALGTIESDPRRDIPVRFATCDLPALNDYTLFTLHSHTLAGQIFGGFGYAQVGNILNFVRRDWADRERPTWDGTLPLQQWEEADRPRHERAVAETTFTAMAAWLHTTCQQRGITSTLDAACQDVLAEEALRLSVSTPWGLLDDPQIARLDGALRHAFLLREIERCQTTLSDMALRPLADWLRREGITSVTIIPGGWLAAFPLLACDIGGGQTFADAFSASVAPSFRSLLPSDRTRHRRSGVATLGNPWPTHQPLKYGQAEALTLAHLGGDPGRCRIQDQATRGWLLECLRTALVVDASCHGVAEGDYLASRLQLADAPLTLADALNQQVADLDGLRLLILSACQTAIPDIRGARNEVRSLAVGMLQAGVEAVLASLWSVDDRATYLLVVRFAQEWFPTMATEPPAGALARAQHWLRNVTWKELQSWEATSHLPAILATMPNYRPTNQHEPVAAEATRLAVVRGGASYPDDDDTRDERYTMHESQDHIRATAERQAQVLAHHRPYAHPFYWAGFQITGW